MTHDDMSGKEGGSEMKSSFKLTTSESNLLDALEDMARQHCYLDGRNQPIETDSGATSADADALRLLAKYGRFRIVRDGGRMVVGFWPEHDPEKKVFDVKEGRRAFWY